MLEKAALPVEHLATCGSAAECSGQGSNHLKSQGPKVSAVSSAASVT